jgi:hypothetical protein
VRTIVRAAYHRKAYYRRPYRRSDGTRVPGAHVKSAYVSRSRIAGRGHAAKTGHKGKKLINMKQDYRHLRKYGYSLHSQAIRRRTALRRAMEHNGYLWPIHKLNALHTLFKIDEPTLSKKAYHDLKFVEKTYKLHKRHHQREHRSTRSVHHRRR